MMMLVSLALILAHPSMNGGVIAGAVVNPPQEQPRVDKRARRDLEKRLERAGELYETLGRCAGSMTIEEVQTLLAETRSEPAGGYLTARFEQGMKRPRNDDEWCRKAVGKSTAKLTNP